MDITRRRFLISSGALTLLGGLAACGKSASSDSSTIQFWNNLDNQELVTYFEKHFVDAYPGPGKVKFSNKSTDTIDRLIQTALAAGSGPDVIVTPGPSTGTTEYTKAGYLVDLDSYATKYNWGQTFASWALDASRIDGKLRTLPTQYETMAFYFNPATVEKLGVAVPRTQSEFEAYCSESKGKGLIPVAAGNADWKGANEWHMVIALNHGAGPAAVYEALQGKLKWTDPVFVDAVTRYAGYFKQGWFGGGVNDYFTNKFSTQYEQLASGKAAGLISGSWEFAYLPSYFGAKAGNNAKWDWTSIPSLGHNVPTNVWDLAIGQSAGINAKSGNVNNAAAYLNFLTTSKTSILQALVEKNAAPPPIKIAPADFGDNADPRTVRLYTALSTAKTIGYTTWTFFPQQTETYLIDYFEKVITGKLSPADYCAGIQEKFAGELRAGKVPPAPQPGVPLS
ncbi:ABC transporter substrate-binding protein [Kribbella speibonae]|nr:extracellular solute-binding protein [Kribbella speibonae]